MKKRYSAISFPYLIDDCNENEMQVDELKIIIRQSVEWLCSVPFFYSDSDFTDFIVPKEFKSNSILKSFRNKPDDLGNHGYTHYLMFLQKMNIEISKLPSVADICNKASNISSFTIEDHYKWLEEVKSIDYSVNVIFDMLEGEDMMCIIESQPFGAKVRRTIQDFEKYIEFVSLQYTSYPMRKLKLKEIMKSIEEDDRQFEILVTILTNHLNYMLSIPYVKKHTLTQLFLTISTTNWRSLVYRDDIFYSIKDVCQNKLMSTLKNVKINYEICDGFEHYCAYLRLLSNEQKRTPEDFERNILTIKVIVEKVKNIIMSLIQSSLNNNNNPSHNESIPVFCSYCRLQPYVPTADPETDYVVLGYIYNRLSDDLDYIEAIISLYECKNRYVKASNTLINQLTIMQNKLASTQDLQSVTKELNNSTKEAERFDNAILFAYSQYQSLISTSYDFLSGLQKYPCFKDLKPIITAYESTSKEYRKKYAKESIRVHPKQLIQSKSASIITKTFEHNFDLAYYICYGVVGIGSKDYHLDQEYTPTILLHYPEEIELPFGIEEFSYPQPIKLRSVINVTEANSILDSNVLKRPQHVFTVTNSSGKSLYGCTMMRETVLFDEETGNLFSYSSAIFLITELPLFDLHFNVLHFLIKNETEYIRNKAVEICESEKNTRAISNSSYQRVYLTSTHLSSLSEPTQKALEEYHKAEVPKAGGKIILPFLPNQLITPKRIPSEDTQIRNADLIFDYCINKPFILSFPVDRILQTIGCILTDHRIVVISNDNDKLTSLILYLITLLYPFPSSHTISLILSDHLVEESHILEGGMGLFIIGINGLHERVYIYNI